MPRRHIIHLAVRMGLVGVLACAPLAYAGARTTCTAGYTPTSGQPGKDVPWIPTPEPLVKRMLAMADVKPSDVVYDLGSGDGRFVIAAARLGAKAVGVEYNPKLVALSRCLIAAAGVAGRARIIHGDFLRVSFKDASVVTLFLLPNLDVKLRPKLLALKPGTRIVSNEYLMGDWPPDRRATTPYGIAYLWIVPAHINGSWRFRSRRGHHQFPVTFVQNYQQLTAIVGSGTLATNTRLRGTHLAFSFPVGQSVAHVNGIVKGGRIDVKVTRRGRTSRYVGTRS